VGPWGGFFLEGGIGDTGGREEREWIPSSRGKGDG